MKHLIVLFLLFTLTANGFAASGVCVMDHEVDSAQSQSMPCHNAVQDNMPEVKTHLCDCDNCAQYLDSFDSALSSSASIETPAFSMVLHKSPTISPNYRPPIYFAT